MPTAGSDPAPRHAHKAIDRKAATPDPKRASEQASKERGRLDPRALAMFVRARRKAPEAAPGQPPYLELAGPWSASAYLRMVQVNAASRRLTSEECFVLGLLAVRADDAGRCRFAQQNLMALYGLEPGDIDEQPFSDALRELIATGWIKHQPGCPESTYILTLPRKRRTRRAR